MPDDRKVLEGIDHLVVDGTNVLHALRNSASPLPAAALIGRLRSIVPAGVGVTLVLDGAPEHGLVSRHVASGVEVRYSGRLSADAVIVNLVERELYGFAEGLLVITDDIGLAGIVRRSGGRTARNGWLMDRLDRQKLASPSIGRPGIMAPGNPGSGSVSPRGFGGGKKPGARFGHGIAPSAGPERSGGPRPTPSGGPRPSGGGPRPAPSLGSGPTPAPKDADTAPDAGAPGWSPGRGATRKRGNGKRSPYSGR